MLKGNITMASASIHGMFINLYKNVYERDKNISWESELAKKLVHMITDFSNQSMAKLLVDFQHVDGEYVKGKIAKDSLNDVLSIFEEFTNATSPKGKYHNNRMKLLKTGYINGINKLNNQWKQAHKKIK